MKKILVIGSCGAGKSTFSRRLHKVTNLPLIHLDRIYWKPNWVETTDKDEWRKIVENVLRGEEWIIDGNYSGTLELRLQKCDTVIFLDFPRTICTWRVIKRFFVFRQRSRPDMAEGCVEKLDWDFIKWTWNYPQRSKPKVEERLKLFGREKTIIRLKSNKDIENFFVDLKSSKVKST